MSRRVHGFSCRIIRCLKESDSIHHSVSNVRSIRGALSLESRFFKLAARSPVDMAVRTSLELDTNLCNLRKHILCLLDH